MIWSSKYYWSLILPNPIFFPTKWLFFFFLVILTIEHFWPLFQTLDNYWQPLKMSLMSLLNLTPCYLIMQCIENVIVIRFPCDFIECSINWFVNSWHHLKWSFNQFMSRINQPAKLKETRWKDSWQMDNVMDYSIGYEELYELIWNINDVKYESIPAIWNYWNENIDPDQIDWTWQQTIVRHNWTEHHLHKSEE